MEERVAAIERLLHAAAEAHHVFERDALGGIFDEQWPAWYGAWIVDNGLGAVLGRDVTREEAGDVLLRGWTDFSALDPKPQEDWAAWTARRVAAEL